MKKTKVQEAMVEAKRFLKRANVWIELAAKDEYIEFGSKAGGALRRASLDLTRALAEMRK